MGILDDESGDAAMHGLAVEFEIVDETGDALARQPA